MIFNGQSRANIKEVESHWKSNFILRLVIIAVDIVAICIFSIETQYLGLIWYTYISLVPSLIWCTVCIILRLSRLQPIHPGVHVGMELSIFAAMLTISVLTMIEVLSTLPWEYPEYFTNAAVGDWPSNVIAAVGLAAMAIIHFYLFVRGCIDTSRRRSHDIATQAAAIAAQMMKKMESRGTFYRRDSGDSYGYNDLEAEAGHIIGLEDLHRNTGFAPLPRIYSRLDRDERMSQISSGGRSGHTQFSHARTARTYRTHTTRRWSMPIPTSPSMRTVRTDEPSLFRLEQYD